MLYVIELYQENKTFVFMQIPKSLLPRHRKTTPKGLNTSCQIRYLILAHCFRSTYYFATKIVFIP